MSKVYLRKIGGQHTNHQICFRFEDMIGFSINYF